MQFGIRLGHENVRTIRRIHGNGDFITVALYHFPNCLMHLLHHAFLESQIHLISRIIKILLNWQFHARAFMELPFASLALTNSMIDMAVVHRPVSRHVEEHSVKRIEAQRFVHNLRG